MTENYGRIIESMGVRFLKVRNISPLRPVTVEKFFDVENTLIFVNKGEIGLDNGKTVLQAGEILFIPPNREITLSYWNGSGNKTSYENYINNRNIFFAINKVKSPIGSVHDSYTYLNFQAKVFDSVNFFASLDIPPFIIKDEKIGNYMLELLKEEYEKETGYERSIKYITELLVVEVIRYLLRNHMFVQQLATNTTYFNDPRLMMLFTYIKENLNSDLSNKRLAEVAQVSEDYVGQYFKMLTGINPQDYIEYQRMELAVNLLRTTKLSIRKVAMEVGYNGTAYFCRRFKMMFGIPAGKMRRRENMME